MIPRALQLQIPPPAQTLPELFLGPQVFPTGCTLEVLGVFAPSFHTQASFCAFCLLWVEGSSVFPTSHQLPACKFQQLRV